jgi:hypothetical protein
MKSALAIFAGLSLLASMARAQNPPTQVGNQTYTTQVTFSDAIPPVALATCVTSTQPGSPVPYSGNQFYIQGQTPYSLPLSANGELPNPAVGWNYVYDIGYYQSSQGLCGYYGTQYPPNVYTQVSGISAIAYTQDAVPNNQWSPCVSVDGVGACYQIFLPSLGPAVPSESIGLDYVIVDVVTYSCPNGEYLSPGLGVCCVTYAGDECNDGFNDCAYYDCSGDCQGVSNCGGGDQCENDDNCDTGDVCDGGQCVSYAEAEDESGGNGCSDSQNPDGSWICNGTECANGCDSTGCNCAPQGCSAYTNAYGNWICDGTLCQNGCVSNGCGCAPTDPIVIDLSGRGFMMTDAAKGVKFDFAGTGNLVQMSWTAGGWNGGWLALDRNGNGKIDNGTELFGNLTPQPNPPKGKQKNGFLALAVYDQPANGGNNNGMIDPGDKIWKSLVVWIDTNHNGVSEPSELIPIAKTGIKSISLNYSTSMYKDAYGNVFRYKSTISDGTPDQTVYDVMLGEVVPNKASTSLTKGK